MVGRERGGRWWGRGRGMKRRGTSDHRKYELTHFFVCLFWWGSNSWFGGLREESSLLFKVLKQISTRRTVGLLLGGRGWEVWGKGRREKETSERGNVETREGSEEREKWFTLYVASVIP